MNQSDVALYRLDGRGPFFLELEYDTLLKSRDTMLANRTALVFAHSEGPGPSRVGYGPFFEFEHARGSGLERARLGALVDFVSSRLWHGARPRLYALTGMNLRDRNRGGQLFVGLGLGADFAAPR